MNRAKAKGRGGKSSYLALPHAMLNHQNYINLPAESKRLLFDIAVGYKGYNNGDLSCTLSLMKKRGWNSNASLNKHLNILLSAGFIVKTRQGGRNRCSLYALTWRDIDDGKGKHDYSGNKKASNLWNTQN